RRPWFLCGSLVGGISLALVPSTGNLVIITTFWVIATITLNSMQPAITTIVADRFSPSERGAASGVVGAAMTAGVSAGTIYGGLMAEHLAIAYALIGAAIILVCFGFVLLNPEPRTSLKPPPPFPFGPGHGGIRYGSHGIGDDDRHVRLRGSARARLRRLHVGRSCVDDAGSPGAGGRRRGRR